MPPAAKFLIGLAAAILIGWIFHAPLGLGESFVGGLEAQARAAVSEVAGVEARLGRDPLSRNVTLSGPADQFQRQGMGQFPGLDDRIGAIEGISGSQWTDQGSPRRGIPLLIESLIAILLAYLVGIGAARLLFGRLKKDSYL